MSVLAQGHEVQHCIVDPGSTDGSRELIEGWMSDPNVIGLLGPDRGPADGLNKGLSAIDGDIWMYLNADDELAPGSIQRVIDAHRAQPQVDVLIGNGWTIDDAGVPIEYVRSDRFSPRRYALGAGTVLQQATSFKSKSTSSRVHFNPENRYNWDTELLFDLHRTGARFGYLDESIGYFRLQPLSITMSGEHEVALAAERARLIRTVRGHRVFRLLSPIARAAKYARGMIRARRMFEGLAR